MNNSKRQGSVEITPEMIQAGLDYLCSSGYLDLNAPSPTAETVEGLILQVFREKSSKNEAILMPNEE